MFSNGPICNVVSTLPNVVEMDVEKHNVVSTLFNVDLTLYDVATSYQPKNSVEPTLKYLLGDNIPILLNC